MTLSNMNLLRLVRTSQRQTAQKLTQVDVASALTISERLGRSTAQGIYPSELSNSYYTPHFHSMVSINISITTNLRLASTGPTSPLCTPIELMIPQDLTRLKAVLSAGLNPTTSITTSAPLPSVTSLILFSICSLSFMKFSGLAPKPFASSRRLSTLSTANRCFGLKLWAAIKAHSPTGPQPITTTVDSAIWAGVRSLDISLY